MSNVERHARRASKFAGVGLVNTVVDFGVFLLLRTVGFPALGANIVGFLCANANSYLLNAGFTFRDRGVAAPLSPRGYLKFIFVHLGSLAISSAFIAVCADSIGAFAAKASASVFTFSWNYAASHFFVFRKKPDTGAKA